MVYSKSITPELIRDLSKEKVSMDEFKKRLVDMAKKYYDEDKEEFYFFKDYEKDTLEKLAESIAYKSSKYKVSNFRINSASELFDIKIGMYPNGKKYVPELPVKDISSIKFDFENVEYIDEKYSKIEGFHEINGFSFFGLWAHGDWECPVFIILFAKKDDEDLYIYAPKKGNNYNVKYNTAYGSEDESDLLIPILKDLGFNTRCRYPDYNEYCDLVYDDVEKTYPDHDPDIMEINEDSILEDIKISFNL